MAVNTGLLAGSTGMIGGILLITRATIGNTKADDKNKKVDVFIGLGFLLFGISGLISSNDFQLSNILGIIGAASIVVSIIFYSKSKK